MNRAESTLQDSGTTLILYFKKVEAPAVDAQSIDVPENSEGETEDGETEGSETAFVLNSQKAEVHPQP